MTFDELIDRINRIDVDRFFKRYVPIIIVLGMLMLFATYLGPLGIVVMIVLIGAVVYFLLRGLR